ncbi:MAG: amino-acid N-acetyltransferase [Gammaproteobacteria bacterium]|nr:amino-acid N-acetyltransferase [Gammaproteobacteria bacterium]
MSDSRQDLAVHWFREAAPFINAYRGRTLVVYVCGEAIAAAGFAHLMQDLALLHALGIRLVIVHGARPQIEERLQRRGIAFRYHNGLRITDEQSLQAVKEAAGAVRVEIEGKISLGIRNSLLARQGVKISSGNFVTAQPLGIHDGVDYQYTGIVRRVDSAAIAGLLDDDIVVLLSPLGYSVTGEVFNLSGGDTAVSVAAALKADKLMLLVDGALRDTAGAPLRDLTPAAARDLLAAGQIAAEAAEALQVAVRAAEQGINRTHLIDLHVDGGIVQELFTRDGIGTMISVSPYDVFRTAAGEDLPGILELIGPLQSGGILIERTPARIEADLEKFSILVREGTTIACGALYPYPAQRTAEIACIAVHQDYQRSGFGDAIVNHLEQRARALDCRTVFALTTRAAHWFIERGYRRATVTDLPPDKQAQIDPQRNSQVLLKDL